MATANPLPEITPQPARSGVGLLVLLASMPVEQLDNILAKLTSCFPGESMVVATPDAHSSDGYPAVRIVPTPAAKSTWTLTAADFFNAHQLAQEHDAHAILILGPEAGSLSLLAVHELASAVMTGSTDLSLPRYELPPRAGLVNSAILYPLTRALFASRARFPLAVDVGLSPRMAGRLAFAAQRFAPQNDALLWPTNEAAVAGLGIEEFDVGARTLPQPIDPDISSILALVTGSLFSDIEAKAAFWQRTRQLPSARNSMFHAPLSDSSADIAQMVEAFRLGYTNLLEIWSLVLPPNSLLGLKRLSSLDAASFRMPDGLWVRIVYDFLLAYRLRTINRGHLLGALIPIYLAWVASHINITFSGTDAERHVETLAAAFEADKPYLVSRWRWPDRFNP